MRTLAIDIETYSDIDIKKAGVYAYAESTAFNILLFAYKYDDDEDVKLIDLTEDINLPTYILEALEDSNIIKTAYNANFERVCLSKFLNKKLPIDQWRCTAVQASMLGLPNNLKDVAKVLGLKQQKDIKGTRLINYFSMPCIPTNSNGHRTRNLSIHDREKWEEFKEYCIQDVRVEVEIRNKLSKYQIPDSEQELYVIDQIINDRGIKVDENIINNAIKFDKIYSNKCLEEFKNLTSGVNVKSNKQIKEYLQSKNIEVDSVDKKSISELLEKVKDDEVKKVLKLKTNLSKTSITKYEAMKRCMGEDLKIRGLLQFYGANRTGRWAGRLVQVHNLPQNHLDNLEMVRELISNGDYELFNMLYDDIPNILSQLIRTAFIPEEGKKFIVCDFSAIEARVIAYLANEQWRIDVFNTHGKIYEASASQMFKVPIESITKTSPLRQKGKIAELALGYGGSVGALKQMGAINMGLEEEELQGLVDSWRSANPNITRFWKIVEKSAINAVKGNSSTIDKGISFKREDGILFITLPSQRKLAYMKPRIVLNRFGSESIAYDGVNGTTKVWEEIETYGGKLVENIVQAVARDCLAESIKRLHNRGYRIIFHVHDEIILETDEDVKVEEIENIMAESIYWAEGLNLTAAGFETHFYKKD